MASVATTVRGSYPGIATANLAIQRHVFAETVTLPAGLTGSQGTAGVAATVATTFSISKNGTTAGTMVFGRWGHDRELYDGLVDDLTWRATS